MSVDKYEAICQIGSPHQGYTLKASQKNDILDGYALLYDYDNRIVATSLIRKELRMVNVKCTIDLEKSISLDFY